LPDSVRGDARCSRCLVRTLGDRVNRRHAVFALVEVLLRATEVIE